jgi:hypothetical protein
MARSYRIALLLALALSTALLVPSSAFGADVDMSEETIEVQLWPEGEEGASVLIVGVRLPEDTPLPATVRLPLPPDAELSWVGEVVGSGIDSDLPREFELVEGTGGTSIEFTLESTYTAQYDSIYRAMDVDNGSFSVSLDWIQTEPVGEVSFAIQIPTSVSDVEISPDPPGVPQANLMGETLYTLAPVSLAPGESTRVTVDYRRPELESSSQSFPLLTILGAALGIAVLALVVVAARQAGRGSTGADE